MAVARVSLRNRLRKTDLKYELISTVHDSIVVDSPKENLDKISKIMYSVFSDLPKNLQKLFNYTPNVNYDCEIKYGPNLTEMTKYVPN